MLFDSPSPAGTTKYGNKTIVIFLFWGRVDLSNSEQPDTSRNFRLLIVDMLVGSLCIPQYERTSVFSFVRFPMLSGIVRRL